MRIAVTGREGQVVRALLERGPARGHDIVALGRPDLDLATGAVEIERTLADAAPDAVVSAAAYTAVDKAESEAELAFTVNRDGAAAVAAAAQRADVPLIHLSTDYVFDGRLDRPYREDDATGPTGVYGASKLAGEQAVLAANDQATLLRTAWVYSPFGGNFIKTMLRLAADRDEVGVVDDQRGNPTSAHDIADAVLTVAENLARDEDLRMRGLFHLAGTGDASWADVAEAVFARSRDRGGPNAAVRRITTADYPTPARRPANSRLDCAKLAEAHGIRLPRWQDSLVMVVDRLVAPSPGAGK